MKKLLTFCLAVNTMFVYANNQNTKAKPTSLKPLKSSMVETEHQDNQLPASNRYADDAKAIAPVVKKEKKQYKPSGKELDRLNKLIEEVLLVSGKLCKNNGITIHKNYKTDKYNFEGIEDQIKQVLLNIIKNAIDSISQGEGKITMSISKTPSDLILEVKDTGMGIEADNIKSIYDPFYTTKGKEGTGLGLSVSYGIIKNHQGNIKIESTIGKGSTVTLTLPITRKNQ